MRYSVANSFQNKRGHHADIVYAEGSEIVLRILPIRHVTASVTRLGTVIINADPHTEKGSQWLAVHLRPRSSSAYYFDSYGIVPLVPAIQAFIRRNCITWAHNRRQLQSLTSKNCRKYCCLFALCMDRGFTPKQFVGLFAGGAQQAAHRWIDLTFASEFGLLSRSSRSGRGDNAFRAFYKKEGTDRSYVILSYIGGLYGGRDRF